MIPDTEDTLESCWSFPHHLKLAVRVRSDGEPVLFIVSTGQHDGRVHQSSRASVPMASGGERLGLAEPPPAGCCQRLTAWLRSLLQKSLASMRVGRAAQARDTCGWRSDPY